MRLWDMRMIAELGSISVGSVPCNATAFDTSGRRLVVATDECTVRIYEAPSLALATSLSGHDESVQCCAFDHKGEFIVTGGSDATMRTWG